MSDGERVALYLLGQVLCAPPRAVIVIDEPEIHLHRAIQASLWDRAEASRPDCIFVYVTHDLEFAGSRSGARKIWTKSFDGNCWEWQEVESSTELPDELVLQVLGSRRPVMFVEGDANSYDSTLYRALYPDRLILPMSSCRRVIGARRAMRELRSFHNLDIEGVIDRDHRSDEEIGAPRSQGLMVADVAEVENLFCVPGALTAAAKQLNVSDTHAAVQAAKARVISELEKMTDSQIAARAIAELQFKLGGFGPKAGKANLSTIQSDLANHVANLDVAEVFKKSTGLFEGIIERKDYDSALRYYNCKGITSFVAGAFGLKSDTYCTMVTGIVRSEEGASLAGEMRSQDFLRAFSRRSGGPDFTRGAGDDPFVNSVSWKGYRPITPVKRRSRNQPLFKPPPVEVGRPPGPRQSRASGCHNRKARAPLDFVLAGMHGQAARNTFPTESTQTRSP